MPQQTHYEPASRRPIAGAFRRTAHGAVALCVRRRIHPDTVSYASVVAAAAAATCFWLARQEPWLLLVAPLLCYVRLWMNMLDGMVALASGKASRRGEILNELPDRVSDVMIFLGVAHSGLCSPQSGYGAALAAVLTAYVGTLGQAVTGHREFGGVMAKPHRMVVLHAGAWIALASIVVRGSVPAAASASLTVLDWTCLAVIVGSVQTIVVRLARTMRRLEPRGPAEAPPVDGPRESQERQ